MTNPTIEVSLSSLDEGTVPSVTNTVDVNEGSDLDVCVEWPSSASNTITCSLNFSESGDQDPFNDEAGGSSTFSLTRATSTDSATNTLAVKNDALLTTDTYDLTLTIDGVNYTSDPTIKVHRGT
ncbi:MAG: hypothetical protein AB8B80_11480 [Marinicellaceae bacterium]